MTRQTSSRFSFSRVRQLLESPYVPLFAALLALLLTSPSIFAGLATEDWIQRDLVRSGAYPLPSQVNMFGHGQAWSTADIVKRDWQYQLYGWFPWITDREFDASFWRPLASLTHHLDYRVFPESPWLMHLESMAWYGALAAAVAVLHRRLVETRWIAGLAAVLYAVDDAHGHPVGWLINRNGVMATLFSVLALTAYDRYRRDGSRRAAWLTALLFGLGLCSAEFALCAAGYFAAHFLFIDRAKLGARLVASSAWILPLLAWALVYRHLGHTAHGSGLYIDPLADPMSYTFELVERGTVLLLGQLGAPFSDTWTRSGPYAQGLLVFWAAMFLWFVAYCAWPVLVRNRTARFWLGGLVLSLPPACATFPEDRLLLLAGVGAFPLIATFIGALVDPSLVPDARRRPGRVLGVAFVAIHALAAPLLLPWRSLHMYRYDREIAASGKSAFSHVTGAAGEALIVVNAPNFYFASMMPITRIAQHEPTVGRMLTLAGTLDDVTLRRLDDHRLEVIPNYGFFSRVFNRIYRSRAVPFKRGSRIDLLGVDVTVSEVNQWGEPTAAIFEFALSLDDPRYRWIAWQGGHYERFVPPAPGTTTVVRGS